jgi:hypothetical protein
MGKPLSSDALDTLFRKARSYIGHLERPVSEAQLRQIWELRPHFGQSLSPAVRQQRVQGAGRQARLGQSKEKVLEAPVTATLRMDTKFRRNIRGLPNDYRAYDLINYEAAHRPMVRKLLKRDERPASRASHRQILSKSPPNLERQY